MARCQDGRRRRLADVGPWRADFFLAWLVHPPSTSATWANVFELCGVWFP